jgi:hypothetical protein
VPLDEVASKDIAKGAEVGDGEYVMLTQESLAACRAASRATSGRARQPRPAYSRPTDGRGSPKPQATLVGKRSQTR